MGEYELTPDAEEDLRGIARYTDRTWGRAQSRRYREQLEHRFTAIARGDVHTQGVDPSQPEIRRTYCQHHFIFFVQEAREPPLIIAVFHENMDLIARLKKRLRKQDG